MKGKPAYLSSKDHQVLLAGLLTLCRRASSALLRFSHALERVFRQAPQRAYAVLPPNLLAFFVSASPVADPHFEDSKFSLRHFDRDLRFESEAVFLDPNGLDHLTPENFVASFHVAEIDVCQAIRQQG